MVAMGKDRILELFLERQHDEAAALTAASDLVSVQPLGGPLSTRYIVHFRCTGLVEAAPGTIEEANGFAVGVWFAPDYVRRADPWQTLTWLGPHNVFHPNISGTAALICIGQITPGTPLVDLVMRCFEVITFKKVTMREDDALNKGACAWAREHQARFPIDARPLKRRAITISVRPVNGGSDGAVMARID